MPSPQLQQAIDRADSQTVISIGDLPSGEKNDQPDFRSPSYLAQMAHVRVVRDVYEGTLHIRGKAEDYLPKYKIEQRADYDKRLERAILFNAVRQTVKGYVGLIFQKDLKLGDDVPAKLGTFAENIDLAGRHIDVFARDVAAAGILDGHTFIHVDLPVVSDIPRRTRSTVPTRADRQNVRPYWTHVLKQDVINWRWEIREGVPTLTLVAIREPTVVPVGAFGSKVVHRIRVLFEGAFEVYEKQKSGEWSRVEQGAVAVRRIPLIPVYSGRTDFMESVPPLEDLAHENVGHYRNLNEHEMSLQRARVPMPFFSGVTEDEVTWGANYAIFAKRQNATATMLESSGNAIPFSQADLKEREARMAMQGASMLTRPDRQTAEAKRIDSAESDSALGAFARGLGDGLEDALALTAEFAGEDQGGSVTINRDFREFELDAASLRALFEGVASGAISRALLHYNMGRGRYLPDDFESDVETAAIQAEMLERAERMADAMDDRDQGGDEE